MRLLTRLSAGLLAAATLILPLSAHAGEDWAHARQLMLDTSTEGADLKEAVSQLPVLVRLHSGNFAFAEAAPDGADLRFFAADNKTPLKYRIERFDATNELAMVWVMVPKLAAGSAKESIWVKWGNDKAEAGQDARGSVDATQVFVLDFSDAQGVKDATANGNHARESTASVLAAGPIGGALTFNGQAHVVLPASNSLKVSGNEGFTVTAWVNPVAAGAGSLLKLGSIEVALDAGVPLLKSGGAQAKGTVALKPGVWQHLAVVYGGGKALFFVDGNPAGEASLSVGEASGEAEIGAGLQGALDEVTLARSARSPSYIKALAASQAADSLMVSFAEGEGGEAEVSYFRILIGAVTLDGWVVIGILGVMAVISLWVMVTKTLNLARAEKANAIFLELFKQKSAQLLDPAHSEARQLQAMPAVQASSIYQLYAVGLHEIAHRFEAQTKAQQPRQLSGAALESIRAALDATIVRANQRFNSGIVLLTIAISGGPFLGLLGTVVGVMITFAAIAAAGDVNVNAIAPGIAAALVATVAGLAVAIPALFAYNWFAIKIKNIGADTQVFADEFLTKSAELHSL